MRPYVKNIRYLLAGDNEFTEILKTRLSNRQKKLDSSLLLPQVEANQYRRDCLCSARAPCDFPQDGSQCKAKRPEERFCLGPGRPRLPHSPSGF